MYQAEAFMFFGAKILDESPFYASANRPGIDSSLSWLGASIFAYETDISPGYLIFKQSSISIHHDDEGPLIRRLVDKVSYDYSWTSRLKEIAKQYNLKIEEPDWHWGLLYD